MKTGMADGAGRSSNDFRAPDTCSQDFVLPGTRRSPRAVAETASTVLMIGDFLVILLGLVAGFWLRFVSGLIPTRDTWWTTRIEGDRRLVEYLGLILVGAAFLFGTFVYSRLYDHRNLLRFRHACGIIVRASTFWLFAYLSLSLVLRFQPPISRIYVLLSYLSALGLLVVWRLGFHRLMQLEAIARELRQKVLFVGWSSDASNVFNAIQSDVSQPYRVAGCVPTPGGRFALKPPPGVRQLGDYNHLPELLHGRGVDIVVLADMDPSTGEIVSLANLCEREHVQFKVIPSFFQILVSGLRLETVSGIPILGVSGLPLDRLGNRMLKRTVDIVGSVVGIFLSAPIITVCAALVMLESPGNPFFGQERVGRHGRRFRMFKLRSMRPDADKADHLNQSTLREDPRVLRIGRFMRRWNLDEVPQFWNVLLGDMSLVGPRPERTFHSERLSHEIPHYNARYASKPGMTGWAQVNGLRGETDLVERVRFDLWYLENWNLWLDFQIMLQTFFRRDNAY